MKKKIIIIVITVFLIIMLGLVFLSKMYFNVWNPFSSSIGIVKILFTNEEYTVIEKNPRKIMISKTGDTSKKSGKEYLDEYMEKRGFIFLPDEQMGAIMVYSNGTDKEYIHYSTNRFYSKWSWE